MSSSKRSGKRSGRDSSRRKRSSKKSGLEHFAQRKEQSLIVDFFFLLMGMITTLTTILLAAGVFSTPSKTNQSLIAAKSGDPTKEVIATDDEEFDELLKSSDAVQLSNILKDLNDWSPTEPGTKRNERRVAVADILLTKKLNTEQRTLAITSKINALTSVYGLGLRVENRVANVTQSLRDTANMYLESPDLEIQKLAKLSLFKVNAFEMAKKGDGASVSLLVNDICNLLKSFPQDDTVLSTADMMVEFYRQKVGQVVASKVTEGLGARKGEFTGSPKVLQLIKDFEDEALLNDAEYKQLFENRWVNGRRGQLQLLQKSMQLAAEPDPGTLLVKSIDAVAHWFEQDDQYENAVAIYDEILKSVDTYQNPEVAALAKEIAQDGIVRSKIVGEKIDLSGFRLNGEPQSVDVLEGKVVLVVFWSAFEPKSSQILQGFSLKGAQWKERGIRILGVNVDRKWDMSLIQKVTKSAANVYFLFGDPQDNYSNNVLQQCPSTVLPRLLLVQKDGHVSDINVPFGEIETQLDFLVAD